VCSCSLGCVGPMGVEILEVHLMAVYGDGRNFGESSPKKI
jgi:hypothetical protein